MILNALSRYPALVAAGLGLVLSVLASTLRAQEPQNNTAAENLNTSAENLNSAAENRAVAQQFLNRYSLGYGLLYACGYSQLPAFLFDYQSPEEMTEDLAGEVSPQLVALILAMEADPELQARTCDTHGLLADHYREPELTNRLIDGLRELDPKASGMNAFENGVYFRIRGYDPDFERYLAGWQRVLEGELLAKR